MFEQKNSIQDKIRGFESHLLKNQNEKRMQESEINNLNIEKAQINAKIDTLKEELKEFPNMEFLNFPIHKLSKNLKTPK